MIDGAPVKQTMLHGDPTWAMPGGVKLRDDARLDDMQFSLWLAVTRRIAQLAVAHEHKTIADRFLEGTPWGHRGR